MRGPEGASVQQCTGATRQSFRKRVDNGLRRQIGREDHHHSVAAILVLALLPGHRGPAEGLVQYPVQGRAQMELDLVIPVRPGVFGDVDGQHGADLPADPRSGVVDG